MNESSIIPPGSTIAIIGDGQLGKMTAQAAQRLGYHVAVWGTSPHAPAMQCVSRRIIAPYTSREAEEELRGVPVVTTEWENVPAELMDRLRRAGHVVRPSSRVLEIAQSRNKEKLFALRIRAVPTPWAYIEHINVLGKAETYEHLLPGILKTNREGYDGKGQRRVVDYFELARAVEEIAVPCILEKQLTVDFECSVLVARNAQGEVRVSDVVRNDHEAGILVRSRWSPCMELERVRKRIKTIAERAAATLELEGILVLEFIVSGDTIYFNEMAPRPHNSFHASIEAADCSQFEQHVRAICNLPLGCVRFHTPFTMHNMLRSEGDEWEKHLQRVGARVHLYGKQPTSGGVRKMGHVTILE